MKLENKHEKEMEKKKRKRKEEKEKKEKKRKIKKTCLIAQKLNCVLYNEIACCLC